MVEKKGNWSLLIVTIFGTLLVAEGALRYSGIAKMTARFTCFHPVIGKVYCASTEGIYTKNTYSHHLVVNTDGMVDREYPIVKSKNTLRVALMGDSFTASEYLPSKDKFEGILEQELSQQLVKQVEILNFGISGGETWDQLQIFHLKSVKYQPDLTLLSLYWGNDIEDNIEQLRAGHPNPLRDEYEAPLAERLKEARKNFNKSLWNSSLLYQVVHDGYGNLERMTKRWLQPSYLKKIDRLRAGEYQGTALQAPWSKGRPVVDTDSDDDDLFFWESAGWEVTRKLILKLKDESEAAGSRLVLLHFPSEGLVRSSIDLPDEEFDAFLNKNGIPHVSLFQDYYALTSEELQQHFIPNDGHWTRYGHLYVAQRLREMLFTALSEP
ncbi:MAG TPA: SGNH/GDSL hydrolase family protein [Gammaproteobacteria bacterium]|nr:SGNH/GDSL hydrolase family protein [Gammaproteobacteria bacterium]